jgi:hypothetical protein
MATQSATLTVNAASAFTVKNLVADAAGAGAVTTDLNLLNPWGIVIGPGPVWVANNHSSTSTLYDGNGLDTSATNGSTGAKSASRTSVRAIG